MSDPAELLDEALRLPEDERRKLALRLLDTVGDEPVEEIERRWLEEARQRRDDIAEGRASRGFWDEARLRILSRGL